MPAGVKPPAPAGRRRRRRPGATASGDRRGAFGTKRRKGPVLSGRATAPRGGGGGAARGPPRGARAAPRRGGRPDRRGSPTAPRGPRRASETSARALWVLLERKAALQGLGVGPVDQSHRVPLHAVQGARRGEPHTDPVNLALLDLEVLVPDSIPQAPDPVDDEGP